MEEISKMEKSVLEILEPSSTSQRDCEKKLFGILSHSRRQLVRLLLKNRTTVYFGILLAQ